MVLNPKLCHNQLRLFNVCCAACTSDTHGEIPVLIGGQIEDHTFRPKHHKGTLFGKYPEGLMPPVWGGVSLRI